MRHCPEPAQVSSLLVHFSSQFAIQSRQPSLQSIINVVLAMAGFECEQTSHVVKELAHRLVDEHRADLVPQEVCNVLWSLAVLNVLDIATLSCSGASLSPNFMAKWQLRARDRCIRLCTRLSHFLMTRLGSS